MKLSQFKDEILPLKDKLYRYALSRVYDPELAKDIVQEVFMKLWEDRKRLLGIKSKEAWAIRCTRNLSLDKQKAKANQQVNLDEVYQVSSSYRLEEVVADQDLIQWVKGICAHLPEKQREIFRLRELLGYSNAEIQEILELDENQVKVYLFRARRKIKEALLKKINYGLGA